MKILILILCFCTLLPVRAQISHGGTPLFFAEETLSSPTQSSSANLRYAVGQDFFAEMPTFDVEEMLEEDAFNASNMRGSFRFAKKFFVSIERGLSGRNYTLPDGTKVWQTGIRSVGAYSINVLFSTFRIPEGGKLFVYSSDRSHVLGAFTHENNSENDLLPIAPVQGEEIIVEYSEPADVPFEGMLKITEVNHDYRGMLRSEPENDRSPFNGYTINYDCMPDILCATSPSLRERDAVVLLIVNGNTACTGTIVNNTRNDETPYLLTAMHCLNLEGDHLSSQTPSYYQQKAGSVVAFFNYNRPICDTKMRGVEEMSMAGTVSRCVIEKKDIALLQLNDTIPDYYQAYYAGWNASTGIGSPPYSNIHHPLFSVKKFGETNSSLTTTSFTEEPIFDSNSFWNVPRWTVGSTEGGSSGSPLFDANNLIIGALSGGQSLCSGTNPNNSPDIFSSLNKGWEYDPSDYFLQLKHWLDPDGIATSLTCLGLDPLAGDPFEQKSNIDFSAIDSLENTRLSSGTGYLFGHNSSEVKAFAEEFHCTQEQDLYGAYLLNPPFNNSNASVKIFVHAADNAGNPGAKIDSVVFRPQYANYSSGNFSNRNKTTTQAGTESFVKFPQKIHVGNTFFIGYEISYPSAYPFSTYNASSGQSTAWINHPDFGWIKSADIPGQSKPTSLAIRALLRNHSATDTSVSENPPIVSQVYYNRETRTISVNCGWNEAGILRLYDISGRLIKQYTHQGPAHFPVPAALENNLGILQWQSEKQTKTVKVIFYR